jgi:cysteine desulfurase/selenocysteine lyase
LVETYLKAGDEVLLTVAEHAANTLPWFKLQRKVGIKVNMIPLDEIGRLTLENVKKTVTNKTKIISIAHVTNVLGYLVDVAAIAQFAHERGIIVVVDGAQSTPHMKVDVKALDCDAFCVSGHKACGPTGVGVLYMKKKFLQEVEPFTLGGGMNEMFHSNGDYTLQAPPAKFEAGTPKIEGALGLAAGLKYLQTIGLDAIHEREMHLRRYAIEKLKKLDNIVIYNEHADCGLITFNIKGVFAQDAATHFTSYGIAIRAGNHCAKMLGEFLGVQMTCRASLFFYNTEEEVDKFVEAAAKGSDYLDAFFK